MPLNAFKITSSLPAVLAALSLTIVGCSSTSNSGSVRALPSSSDNATQANSTDSVSASVSVATSRQPRTTVTPTRITSPLDSSRGHLISTANAIKLGYLFGWTSDIAITPGNTLTSVTQLDDIVLFVESPSNVVTAVNLADGSVRWKERFANTAEPVYAPVTDGELIYFNTTSQMFGLDPRNGTLRYVFDLAHVVSAGATVFEGDAIFGAVNGFVFSQRLSSGIVLWQYRMQGRITTPATVIGSTVLVTDESGIVRVIRANNGQAIWTARAFEPVVASPVLDRVTVYVASMDRAMYGLSRADGSDRWSPFRSTVPLSIAPIVGDQLVYLAEPGLSLVAVSAQDGKAAWKIDRPLVPFIYAPDALLAAGDGSMTKIDPDTGRVIADAPVKELQQIVAPGGDQLILVSPTGSLQQLVPAR